MSRAFVLLDRDGTINIDRHYLSDPDQLALIPGAGEALKRLRDMGFGLAVVTNQSGIARGYFDQARLDAIHARLAQMLAAFDVTLDGIYACPHGPADGCACRKPLPGLAQQAGRELDIDFAKSFVIGDKPADIDLGRVIGATPILVRTGHGAESERKMADHPLVVDDLPAAVDVVALLRG